MAVNTPEELLNRVTEFINNKDLDSFISVYESDATFVDESGENIHGTAKIREIMKGYMDLNGKFESAISKIIYSGDLALAYSDWTFNGSDPDGTPINLGGTAIDVLRKQSDSSWLVVIDNPWGIKN